MKMKKVLAIVIAIAMVSVLLAACGTPAANETTKPSETVQGNNETSKPAETTQAKSATTDFSKIKIGAMPADPSVGFFQTVGKGMKAAGEAFGCQIDLQYTNRNLTKELSLTESYISQGFKGLVMNASDSAAITGCLQKAKDAGVPMVSVDTVPQRTGLAASTVTSDNYKGGFAAGELMKKLLPEGGDIIMTKLNFASVAMDERYKGFEDAIKDSKIKIIATVEQNGTREDTLTKIAPMLSKYANLAGIYCTQGDPAIGALSAVNTAGLKDKVKIISYDVEDEVAKAIAGDTAIKGGVTQFPYAIGYLGVYQCLRAIAGQDTEEIIKLPVLEVTKDNVAEFSADSIAFLEKYGKVKLPTTIQ